ncbi:DUF4235 domain-containing protein [Enemella evansiae]|nr:DUF4235 domain-containing protein [Enemella evansiae]PFG67017.1 uncharacterized protein DUF4235 [Propionibacteriaceae bacterium ES.041]TDO92884.1 uncharacterized protein DUF4235 [Enemella evansiae]
MQSRLWKIYTAVIGTVSTIAAQKLVSKSWEIVTGEEPPEPGDPDTPLHLAVTWSIASAVGIGVVQLLTNRSTLRRMRAALGDDALPGKKMSFKI